MLSVSCRLGPSGDRCRRGELALAAAQWLSAKLLLQWQFFDHMGTFYEETAPSTVGFSPLEGGQENCSLCLSVMNSSFSQQC